MPVRRAALVAEAVGTAFLVAAVVGSGIMGERLAGGNVAVALLTNTVATAAALLALITSVGPVSGAHFNPLMSLEQARRGSLPWPSAWRYVAGQCVGGLTGVVVAHLMFDLAPITLSTHVRSGPGQLLGELVATFGLVFLVLLSARHRPSAVPAVVASYIAAAYWFTSSTSFANPAVTIARALTDTFAGIRPHDVPAFVIAQGLGALAASHLYLWMEQDT